MNLPNGELINQLLPMSLRQPFQPKFGFTWPCWQARLQNSQAEWLCSAGNWAKIPVLQNGAFHRWGYPKWMVYNGQFHKTDDLGVPLWLRKPPNFGPFHPWGGKVFSAWWIQRSRPEDCCFPDTQRPTHNSQVVYCEFDHVNATGKVSPSNAVNQSQNLRPGSLQTWSSKVKTW